MKVSKRAAIAAAIVAAGGATIPAALAANNPQGGTSADKPCNDGVVHVSPDNLWPPNHQMVPVTVTYTDNEGDGDTTSVSVTGVTEQDGGTTNNALVGDDLQGSGAPGSVQGPDAAQDMKTAPTMGSDPSGGSPTPATWTEDLRAERSGTDGHGSGRIYTITVQCTDMGGMDMNDPDEGMMQTGTATLIVTVPHDQGVVKQ